MLCQRVNSAAIARELSNTLPSVPVASAKSVIDEANFISSGEPKIWRIDWASLASTIAVHAVSLRPRSGWARYARASAGEPIP